MVHREGSARALRAWIPAFAGMTSLWCWGEVLPSSGDVPPGATIFEECGLIYNGNNPNRNPPQHRPRDKPAPTPKAIVPDARTP